MGQCARWVFLVVALVGSVGTVWAFPATPDLGKTSGDLCSRSDRDYQGQRYPERIAVCERNVGRGEKERIYDQYRIPENCRKNFIIDHFVPLSVGGSNSHKNLWPQHQILRNLTNDVEFAMFEAVRDGRLGQQEAISRVRHAKLNPPLHMLQKAISDCDRVDTK